MNSTHHTTVDTVDDVALSPAVDGAARVARLGWRREAIQTYSLAVVSVAVAFLLRWSLDSILNEVLPFAFFMVPIVVSAWRGGLGPSVVSGMLGLGLAIWFFIEPRHSLGIGTATGWISTGVYLATAAVVCWFAEKLRRVNGRLRQTVTREQHQRERLGREVEERRRVEEKLARHEQELECLVAERTAEVERLKNKLQEENEYLREKVQIVSGQHRMVGKSEALQRLLTQAEQVAPTDSTVLILGETGVGKELLAAYLHSLGPRRDRALVSVNCAAIPAALVESELFGREKGAYTGSLSRQIGRFELADSSTIFLDEVGELSPEVQGKLLRVLEAKQIERLGNPKPIPVNVRVIAATNRDLDKDIQEGKFRQDLYYRLNVFPITVPPLRDRREDIPLLIWAFVDEFARTFNKNIESVDRESMEALQRHSWPGNVRELRNLIERAMILAAGPRLRIQLPSTVALSAAGNGRKLEEVERQHILSVLENCGWRVRGNHGAAVLLGLKPTTLEARMAKLGIRRPEAAEESV